MKVITSERHMTTLNLLPRGMQTVKGSGLLQVGSCVCLGDSADCTRLVSISLSLMQQRVGQLV